MTDEKARLRWFFDHTSDDVKRCALAVGAIYLDLIKQQPANAPETVEPFADDDIDDDETTAAPETPAPIVETPVEEKQQRTPQYVPGMDLNVFRAQINAVNGVKAAEHDEDILRGKIKPDDD